MNFKDIYPNFNVENANFDIDLQKILPLVLSNKNIGEILPNMFGENPLLANIFNLTKKQNMQKKIESDKIDVTSLNKVN